jgi:hypothetical protein
MVVVFAFGALDHPVDVVPLVAFLADSQFFLNFVEIEVNFAFVLLQNGVDLG